MSTGPLYVATRAHLRPGDTVSAQDAHPDRAVALARVWAVSDRPGWHVGPFLYELRADADGTLRVVSDVMPDHETTLRGVELARACSALRKKPSEAFQGNCLRKPVVEPREAHRPVTTVTLDHGDALELAELLQFLSDWLARDDHRRDLSLADYVGHPAYGPRQLRCDLDRFAFLLGGNDGESLFGTPDSA